ncbi:MAG: septal ring lytic transglycosylase RlpA family protein [Pseudomonadota bacterium]
MKARCITLLASLMVSACTPFAPQDSAPSRTPTGNETQDAVPRDEPLSRRGNPPYYDQFGQRYYVLKTAKGYNERGVASWYGKKFHGRQTSNGEIFDMYAMTAAHKTLPLPAYVEVTNLRNGKKAVLRVNDRGPFVDNRIIDLSYAAATKLGIVQDGTGLVEVRTIDASHPHEPLVATPKPKPVVAPSESANIYIQVGAFSEETNAIRLHNRIRRQGISKVVIAVDTADATAIHRVKVGPLKDVDELDKVSAELKRMGVQDTVLAFD